MSPFLTEQQVSRVLSDVRAKKDLAFLSTDFIVYHASEQLRLNPKLRKAFADTTLEKLVRSKAYDDLVKHVRAKARTPYAIFQVPSLVQRRKELLETASLSDAAAMDELLQTHLSTKERIPIYPQLLAAVRERLGGSISSVLDLACGLNPLAYYHLAGGAGLEAGRTQFVCNEFSDLDCEHLNTFFKRNKLPGIAEPFDLVRDTGKLRTGVFAQRFDVCFLLKTLDTLESQKLYVTYDVLKSIHARLIVASFPIANIKGERMQRSAQIHWFEKMLGRLEFSFQTLVLGDEVFYFCRK